MHPKPTARPRRESSAVRLGRSVHLNIVLLSSRSLGQLDEICRTVDITHAQYVALFVLCLAEDPDAGLPIGEVADGLLNPASDTTRLIDRLERAGLTERLPNPADRRGVLVRATKMGKAVFEAVTPKIQALHRRQWSNLTHAETVDLDRLLFKALWGDSPPPVG
jgi:MarR family multiple antibiotic resistance transcriptional regulator